MKLFKKLFVRDANPDEKDHKTIDGLANKLTSIASDVRRAVEAPCVILIACSMDEDEILAIGCALSKGTDQAIVRILERGLEAARAGAKSGPTERPS